jgi:hypothetical protein
MVFPLIEILLPGQKFISTLLSDILMILGIIASFHEIQKITKMSFKIPS